MILKGELKKGAQELEMGDEEKKIQNDDDLDDINRISIRESIALEKLTDEALFDNRLEEAKAQSDARIEE